MDVNAGLRDYMIYNTAGPKVNLKVGTLDANLSGTIDKLSGEITMPSAITSINSNYVGDTNAYLRIKDGVVNFENVTFT